MDPLILFVPEKKGNNEKKINNDVTELEIEHQWKQNKNLTENKGQEGIKSLTQKYLKNPTSPTWRTFFTPSKNPESTKRAKKHT